MIEDHAIHRKQDAFWSIWLVLAIGTVSFLLFCMSGCADDSSAQQNYKVVTKEEKDVMEAEELCLPPGAKNIHKYNEEWHSFELVIDGRTRKFLRRTYSISKSSGQAQYSTDAFTELTPQ